MKKMKQLEIADINHIHEVAHAFLEQKPTGNLIAFYGPMGVGKTTFIKAICEIAGVEDVVTSPTFAIVNEYSVGGVEGKKELFPFHTIYHFDFYRIKKLEEVYDMGYEDYFYGDGLCVIEWPELIEDLLPNDAIRVTIAQTGDGKRVITF